MKNKKKKKLLNKIMFGCLIVILLELSIMAIMKISRERNLDRINLLNDIIKTRDGYVAVGESDFHNSDIVKEKTYEFKNSQDNIKQNIIATQARIAKYDNDMNLIWERTYDDTKYDSTYYGLLEVDDGYIVVGSVIDEYKQIEAKTRNAIIVKYDNEGRVVWKNTYKVLSDTEFYKIIQDDDYYVVIGQSIYENMEMGSHITGGGIIVRYNSDGEEIAHNNYGGNKSGIFNDIIKVKDGYIVCGKDAANYGIVVKFKKDFNRDEEDYNLISKKVMWQRTYSNTDDKGFTGMTMVGDTIYAVGAINISNEKDDDGKTIFKYDAGMVMYNKDGKYLGKYNIEADKHHRFTSVLSDDKYLYLSMDMDVDAYYKGEKQVSKLIKYDYKEKRIVNEYLFDGKNNYIIKKLRDIDNKHMYVGTTNNNCTIRGCDYENLYGYLEELKASGN